MRDLHRDSNGLFGRACESCGSERDTYTRAYSIGVNVCVCLGCVGGIGMEEP
jgi:hypothetical protein